jgi:hypothetical protein
VTLKGYLQDYFQHLKPGEYQVPYSLRWTYYVKSRGPIEAKTVETQGQFQFVVGSPDSGKLKEYLSQRVAIVNQFSDLKARDRAALEITRIDDPAVLPYLKVLKGIGYESEVLDSSQRLPDPAATEILASVAVSSKDIGNVKYALKAIEDRGAQVPVDTVRALLNSKDKWVQIAGLEYVERSGRREFQEDVDALVRHADRDVSAAAQKAKNKLEGIPQQ